MLRGHSTLEYACHDDTRPQLLILPSFRRRIGVLSLNQALQRKQGLTRQNGPTALPAREPAGRPGDCFRPGKDGVKCARAISRRSPRRGVCRFPSRVQPGQVQVI